MRYEAVQALMRSAIQYGGVRNGLTSVSWDVAGSCQDPRYRVVHGKPGRDSTGSRVGLPLEVNLRTRCRKCDKCRSLRRAQWSARARHELRNASRSWFCTFTVRPEEQYRALVLARRKAKARGLGDFDALPFDVQFKMRHDALGPEITRYLKRLREASGSPVRFLWVAEAHKSGAPHYHALIHERAVLLPVRHAMLSSQWKLGFSKCKLADADDDRSALYLCKYLSKSSAARVRASLRYGTALPYWTDPLPSASAPSPITSGDAITPPLTPWLLKD